MSKITISCPACKFTNEVEVQKIPKTTKRVTCPKCKHLFPFGPSRQPTNIPSHQNTGPAHRSSDKTLSLTGRSDSKANKICFAIFLLLVVAVVGVRLWSDNQALNTPRPTLLASSEDGVAVISGTSVYTFDTDGTLLGNHPFPDEIWPTQLYWDRGELCLADLESKNTLILNNGGSNLRSFAGVKLSSHFKVAREPKSSQLFVTDGHRVLVFDENGNYLRTFGKAGTQAGELKFPNGLAFNEAGQLLIANTKRPSIDVYSQDGRFLKTLITPEGDKTYRYPTHILISNGLLITLERDGYLNLGIVRLYDQNGNKLKELSLGDKKSIGDIVTYKDNLYLTDRENRQLLAFSLPELNPLGSFSEEYQIICEQWAKEEAFYNNISRWSLVALLVLCAPVILFYIRIKKAESQRVSEIDLGQVTGTKASNDSKHKAEELFLSTPIKKVHLGLGLILLSVSSLGMLFAIGFPKSTNLLWALSIAMPAFLAGVIIILKAGVVEIQSRKQAEVLFKRIVSEGKLTLQAGEQVMRVALAQQKTSHLIVVLLVFTNNRLLSYTLNWQRVSKIEQFPYQAIQQVQNTSGRFLEVMQSIEVTMNVAGETKKLKYCCPSSSLLKKLKDEFSRHIGRNSQIDYATLCLTCIQPMQGDYCATCVTRLTADKNAMWLSILFPGLGQLRNGELQKGLVFLVGTVILLMIGYIGVRGWFYEGADLSMREKFNIGLLITLAPVFYIGNIVDAYRTSVKGRKS